MTRTLAQRVGVLGVAALVVVVVAAFVGTRQAGDVGDAAEGVGISVSAPVPPDIASGAGAAGGGTGGPGPGEGGPSAGAPTSTVPAEGELPAVLRIPNVRVA